MRWKLSLLFRCMMSWTIGLRKGLSLSHVSQIHFDPVEISSFVALILRGLFMTWITEFPYSNKYINPLPAQPTFTEEMNAKYHLSTMRIILWLTIALDIGVFSMPSADGTLPSKLTSKDSSAKTLPQVGWSWTRQSLRTRRRWWQTRSTGQWRTASWSDWPARLGLLWMLV